MKSQDADTAICKVESRIGSQKQARKAASHGALAANSKPKALIES